MNWQTLDVKIEGRVATVTLNRPDVRNAFNETTIAEITQVFSELGADDKLRAIVLAANGPAFCAGADLNWMKKMAGFSRNENLADATQLADMLRTIHACPKPVVAKVQGDCYAGGMGLVAACDIAVASTEAKFCLSEIKLGLVPAMISPYVIRAIGETNARRYFLTGEVFDAAEAYRIGFVHDIAPPEELDGTVNAILGHLVAGGPQAMGECKSLIRAVAGRPIDAALAEETAARIARRRASDEAQEGIASFFEKRKPSWLPKL